MQFNFSSLSYQLFSTDFQLSLACWNFCNVCCDNIKLICIWHKNCECFLFGEKFWFEFLEMSSDKRNNIFHNFWKSGQRVYQTFQNFLTGYFHSIWLCFQNFHFRLNGLYRDFWNFSRNCLYHLFLFWNFWNFWSNGKYLLFHITWLPSCIHPKVQWHEECSLTAWYKMVDKSLIEGKAP